MPAPCDGSQRSPSLSVIAERLSVLAKTSCETIVRPTFESVQRIGSKLSFPVICDCLATHVELGVVGQESSKDTRNVVTNDWKRALPVTQFAPMDGSPASMPSPDASCAAEGVKRLKRGGRPLAGVAAGNGTRCGALWKEKVEGVVVEL